MIECNKDHMFTGYEAAIAYATAAERIFGGAGIFLTANPSIVPIFVSHLFQSLEISIKVAGIESGLFSMKEARACKNRSGHGIAELAVLAVEKLGGDPFHPIIMAMTFSNANRQSAQYVKSMICGKDMEKTREVYASRCLGYGEIASGDFALIYPIPEWIESVKQTAANLASTVAILRQWKASLSNSKHFAIWLKKNDE
jgi:hypothetical protein